MSRSRIGLFRAARQVLGLSLVVSAAAGALFMASTDGWRRATAATATAVLCGSLALARAQLARADRGLEALTDGVRSFQDRDFSVRLADDAMGELAPLARLYNELGETLRTERNRVYQRELLLDTVLHSAPLAVVLVGPGERVVYSNRAAARLLGKSGKLEGGSFAQILAGCRPELAAAVRGGTDTLFTVPVDGEEETYRAAQRSFRLHTQLHVLYLLERLTPELRRHELAAWKRAMRIVLHELNNSLAPVQSLAHSARQIHALPAESHRMEDVLGTIEERVAHLSEFLKDYARLARLPLPRKERVSWSDWLGKLQDLESFEVDGALPAGAGWFDPTQMQQVMINLLKNAREAGSQPSDIKVAVRSTPETGVEVIVSDRGKGMTAEELKGAAGQGLGLSLCNEILQAHGGHLQISRSAQGGTFVRCWLPEAAP